MIRIAILFIALTMMIGCTYDTTNLPADISPATPEEKMSTGVGSTREHKDGWSQSGKLTTLNPNNLVSLQANFPIADVYTVQFAVGPPSGGVFRAIATISWTVEGNTIVRQVDVGNGVSISAPSQAVRVQVVDATDPAKIAIGGQQYGVTISVTRGVRPFASLPPVLFGETVSIPAGSIAVVNVPHSAGVTSVEVTALDFSAPATNPIATIRQQNTGDIKSYAIGQGDNGFVAVAPSVTHLTIQNLDLANPILTSLTWGIDG